MRDINRLPLAQMRILLRLWNSPNKMGFAEGREEGGSVKELSRKGLVEPAGKVGRRIRWKLVNRRIKQKNINLMSKLVKPQKTFGEKMREILGKRATDRNMKTARRLVSQLKNPQNLDPEKFVVTAARIFTGIGRKTAVGV